MIGYNDYMKYDEKNLVIDNVLTELEIETIYSNVEKSHRSYLMERFTQNISDFELPNEIANKIINYAENISGVSDLEIAEYQFSRYKNTLKQDGTVGKPILPPHYDETFREPRFTFDYQIGGNTTWPIIVENIRFELQNNQALTFGGTHQVHWREKKEFSDEQYIDMIFVHLRQRGAGPKSDDVNNIMDLKADEFRKQYGITETWRTQYNA